jgi:carbon-monoxide dehydrogenase medium subunit
MIPVAFDYCRPGTLVEAHAALAGGDAVILSGGQSLMTDLKLRRKRPQMVVDLQAIAALSAVDVGNDAVRIGAMVRQADLVADEGVVSRLPLLKADPMVRRRGTLVGALCAVEQGGDWLAGCLAMEGVVEIAGAGGSREMPLTEFVRGARTTALGSDEIVVAVRLHTAPRNARAAYRKVKHIAIGWSIASVAVVLDVDGGRCSLVRIAVSGATTYPQRLTALEEALATIDVRQRDRLHDAVTASLTAVTFWGDYYASADYRAERLANLIEQTVAEIAGP